MSKTIALVDDESNILISVSMALETEGFKVDTFKNGEEAIKGLEIKKYGRIIIERIYGDWTKTEMRGLTLVESRLIVSDYW